MNEKQISFRNSFWLGFFTRILLAWIVVFDWSLSMRLDLLGRPNTMAEKMCGMDQSMEMPMARFTPLFGMWAIMMAAMMLPTMVPTLRSYEDLMISADGTRFGWLGLLLGYMIIWLVFAAAIASVQLLLLYQGIINMLGIAKSRVVAVTLLITVSAFQFTRIKELCHGICHSPTIYLEEVEPALCGWRSYGSGPWCLLRRLLLGLYNLEFCRGRYELVLDGSRDFVHGLRKLSQIGHRVKKPIGILLIVGGVVLAIT